VIADYMGQIWSLREVELTFDEVDRLFFPVSKVNYSEYVNGQHTKARLAVHR
jgi:hypothetical protein